MPSVKDILSLRFLPVRPQVGLAVVRVVAGLDIFVRHGWEKNPTQWAYFWARFERNATDPIGIGPHATFVISFTCDFICSFLVAIGLGARWAALFCFGDVFVAWAFEQHFAIIGQDHWAKSGEHMVLYLAALLCIFIAGPGAASVDGLLARRRRQNTKLDMPRKASVGAVR